MQILEAAAGWRTHSISSARAQRPRQGLRAAYLRPRAACRTGGEAVCNNSTWLGLPNSAVRAQHNKVAETDGRPLERPQAGNGVALGRRADAPRERDGGPLPRARRHAHHLKLALDAGGDPDGAALLAHFSPPLHLAAAAGCEGCGAAVTARRGLRPGLEEKGRADGAPPGRHRRRAEVRRTITGGGRGRECV